MRCRHEQQSEGTAARTVALRASAGLLARGHVVSLSSRRLVPGFRTLLLSLLLLVCRKQPSPWLSRSAPPRMEPWSGSSNSARLAFGRRQQTLVTTMFAARFRCSWRDCKLPSPGPVAAWVVQRSVFRRKPGQAYRLRESRGPRGATAWSFEPPRPSLHVTTLTAAPLPKLRWEHALRGPLPSRCRARSMRRNRAHRSPSVRALIRRAVLLLSPSSFTETSMRRSWPYIAPPCFLPTFNSARAVESAPTPNRRGGRSRGLIHQGA